MQRNRFLTAVHENAEGIFVRGLRHDNPGLPCHLRAAPFAQCGQANASAGFRFPEINYSRGPLADADRTRVSKSAEISLREKRRLSDGVNVRKRSRGLEQLRSPMKGQRVLGAFLGGDDRSFRYFLARLLCAVVVCAGQAKKNQAAYKRGGTTNQQCQAQWINFLAFSPISTGRQPGS